jgi:hypothetical protein
MEPFKPEDWLRFVRFPAFTRDWERFGLSDADLRALEPAPTVTRSRRSSGRIGRNWSRSSVGAKDRRAGNESFDALAG